MNFKEKINKLNVDAMSNEEVYALWGTTEKAENDKMDKLILQMNFKARAELGRMRNERMHQLKHLLRDSGRTGAALRQHLTMRYPAMQFRNLEQLTDEQLEQIMEDVEVLEMLEQEDEQSK